MTLPLTPSMTIDEFCDKHNACSDGREWAKSTGLTTIAEVWNHPNIKYDYFIWIATRNGVFTDKELRLFACWCVRQVWHLITDERSRKAVEISEAYANGNVTQEELADARAAAWGAAWGAARGAARDSALAAAKDSALAAAMDSARAAARAAAWDAARDAQIQYLRNLSANFV